MKDIFRYATQAEKDAIIQANAGRFLIEERKVIESYDENDQPVYGEYLVYDDVPEDVEKYEYRKLPLASITPEQVDSYIENNVTDLASAKDVLKMFGKALIRLARKSGM